MYCIYIYICTIIYIYIYKSPSSLSTLMGFYVESDAIYVMEFVERLSWHKELLAASWIVGVCEIHNAAFILLSRVANMLMSCVTILYKTVLSLRCTKANPKLAKKMYFFMGISKCSCPSGY